MKIEISERWPHLEHEVVVDEVIVDGKKKYTEICECGEEYTFFSWTDEDGLGMCSEEGAKILW